MSHRRHRLVRGRPSRINALVATTRVLNQETQNLQEVKERQKEEMFGSVQEALAAHRKKRR